jgi:hypothetical protein
VADSSGVHAHSVMLLLKGHVHPIDVDVAEHAVGTTVEMIVTGTKTSVLFVGVESLVMFGDVESEKLTVVTADEETGLIEIVMPFTSIGASVSFADGELEVVTVMNDSVPDSG